MSVLANLLRLHRRECEDRRRYATELEHLVRRLRADAGRLRGEMASASNVSNDSGPLAERYLKLAGSVAELDRQLGAAHTALAAAEQQLKLSERAVLDRTGGQALSDRRLARRVRQSRLPAPRRDLPTDG